MVLGHQRTLSHTMVVKHQQEVDQNGAEVTRKIYHMAHEIVNLAIWRLAIWLYAYVCCVYMYVAYTSTM
jgi:hypothetical protein